MKLRITDPEILKRRFHYIFLELIFEVSIRESWVAICKSSLLRVHKFRNIASVEITQFQ